ncbi:MAG: peptidylprolyl isomerase [Candidatus Zixiibacteriota bacterium]|nr:MAG: peptidylprolyl isomerase [candidate division Zixibacteria bacterium]
MSCGGQKAEQTSQTPAEEPAQTATEPEATMEQTPEQTTEPTAEEAAIIDTRFGRIVLEFFPDVAPNHVANFKKLAREGFYDGTTFHRVIPGFMIQGGDPNSKDENRANDGSGGPGYSINAEFNSKKHVKGTLSMARSQDPNSAGSQFFITVADVPHLDGQYTVFGRVIQGQEVADQIVAVPRDARDNPTEPVQMQKVSIVPRDQVK